METRKVGASGWYLKLNMFSMKTYLNGRIFLNKPNSELRVIKTCFMHLDYSKHFLSSPMNDVIICFDHQSGSIWHHFVF